jgi:SET domain-containing protein 6
MDVDGTGDGDERLDEENSDGDDEEMDDSSDIAMVPMADLLNARYESENVSVS